MKPLGDIFFLSL